MLQSNDKGGQKIPIGVRESAGCDNGGFTLIEIVVVVSLISLILVFSFPQLSGFLTVNNKNKAVRWLIAQRTVLRAKALEEQARYVLRVDINGNRILAMPMPEASLSEATTSQFTDKNLSAVTAQDEFICSGDLDIVGVAFPDGQPDIFQTADIIFSEKGYCDRAVIHMKDGGTRFSIYFPPFLPRVVVYDGHIKFGQRWEKLI